MAVINVYLDNVGYFGMNVHSTYLDCSYPKEEKVLLCEIVGI